MNLEQKKEILGRFISALEKVCMKNLDGREIMEDPFIQVAHGLDCLQKAYVETESLEVFWKLYEN